MKTKKRAGFTLVEIMVVVVVIGMLAAFALPAMGRINKKANGTKLVNDLRQFSAAFEQYNLEHGGWPPDVDAFLVPPGMESYMKPEAWATPLPGGHAYDWDFHVNSVTAAISIRPKNGYNADPIFAEIDRALDDGNPATGNFRLVSDRYMLILQN